MSDKIGSTHIPTDITSSNHNDLQNKDAAGNHTKLVPSSDSTSAIQITKADGVTPVLIADTTNNNLYLNGDRSITDDHHIVDKAYVDTLVTNTEANFYMYGAADSSVPAYKQTSSVASSGASASTSITQNSNSNFLIASWISPSGVVFSKMIEGIYNWNIFAAKPSGNRVVRLYWELVERKADTSEVVIATSSLGDILNATKTRYRIFLALSEDYVVSSGSRIVGKIYASYISGSNSTTTTVYYEGTDDSHWDVPSNTEFLANNFFKLDQTTPQTLTGTPTFPVLKVPKIYPSSDSATAIQVTKADSSTAIGIFDTTNSRFIIGSSAISGANSQFQVLGPNNGTSTARTCMTFGNGGYTSPSNINTEANGDKWVFWNGTTYKGAIGFASFEMWFQSTSVASGSTNKFRFYGGQASAPVEILAFGTGSSLGYVWNDTGLDLDYRIEGDTDANLLFCDASADKVGVGNNAPAEKLDVTGNIKSSGTIQGQFKSSDGTAGITETKTFYAASSSGGSPTVLNTITIKDGIITSWTQA